MPAAFKVRLFKCFLDAAVSEQIARMVAMKAATENADDMIKALTQQYNRARQAQITNELIEIIGGAEALEIRSDASARSSRSSNASDLTTRATHGHSDRNGNTGKITQVIGSTFDAEFDEDHLPEIYNAVKIDAEHKGVKINLTGEVQQHLGGSRVRCVALGSTDGLVRGMDVVDTGGPVTVPVGKETLGRVFNLLGEPIDGRGPVNADGDAGRSTASRPTFAELSPKTELFETGIKVIDLLTPLVRGGKAGLFGGAGLGKTVILTGADRPHRQVHTAATRCSPASASGPAKATTSGSKCRKPRSATPAGPSSSRPAWSSAR